MSLPPLGIDEPPNCVDIIFAAMLDVNLSHDFIWQATEKDPYASLRSIASRAIVLVIRDRACFTNTNHEHE
jgi:hypothetical protein